MKVTQATQILLVALCFSVTTGLRAECEDIAAVTPLERAVKNDSKNATNYYNLAAAYYNNQCYDKAIDAFERTVKLVKGDSPEHKNLRFECASTLGAMYYSSKGDADESIRWFKIALEIKPDDKISVFGYALALQKLGKDDEALQWLKKTLLLDRRNGDAQYRIAIILNSRYEQKPEPELLKELIRAFEDASALAESDRKANKDVLVVCYNRLGELYRDATLFEKSTKVLIKTIELEPNDFNSRFLLGRMYYEVKDFGSMLEQYQKAVEIDPKHKGARFNLGSAYFNLEKFPEAYDQFKAITDLIDPNDTEALALQGQMLGKAIEQLNAQGASHFTAEEYREAVNQFGKVLLLDPNNKIAQGYESKTKEIIEKRFAELTKEANGYLKSGKKVEAAEALEKAQALKPEDEDTKAKREKLKSILEPLAKKYLSNGDKFYKKGLFEQARKEYDKVVQFPKFRDKAKKKLADLDKKFSKDLAAALGKGKSAMAKKPADLISARNAYRLALQIQADNRDAKNGFVLVNSRIVDEVKRLVEKASKYQSDNDKPKAKKNFEEALRLDPNNADANSAIKALTGTESKAKVNADQVKTLYYQGVDHYVNNRIAEAIKSWQKQLELDPNTTLDAKKNIERAKAKLAALEKLRG